MAEPGYDREAPEPADGTGAPGGMFLTLKQWYRQDAGHAAEWRKDAEEDFRFYNGHQWTAEEEQALRAQMRPALTFNRTAPLVNAIVGTEINNRREVRYIPREPGDNIANEVLSGAAEWFRDQCDAEDEESDAFADTVVCGMGWTETRMSFEEDPDGEPKIERIDPLEMLWDCASRKPNLVDAKRVWRIREMDKADAEAMFPDADPATLDAGWAKAMPSGEPHNQDLADEYRSGDAETEGDYGGRSKVTIVECQWFVTEPFYRVAAPPSQPGGEPELLSLSEAEYQQMQAQMPGLQAVRQTRRAVRRAFLGATVLEEGPGPGGSMFTYECITGYRDQEKGYWYGIVRPTKDPQRWANKFLSQIMHILNSSAKGGILAERDAFEDQRQAEESWAKTERITWTNAGAMAAGKIQPKPQAQYPQGFDRLMEFSISSMRDVTGVNMELMGLRDANQPGVLEAQRKQSGMTMLAGLFDSLRRYRKRQGRLLLYYIQKYLADGRLVRIVGKEKAQYVPLTREQAADKRYDIIVDDAPSSPNEKEKIWAVTMQMMPILAQVGIPNEVAVELLRYSPFPASLVEKLSEQVKKMGEPDPEKQREAEMQKQMAMAAAQAEIQKKNSETEENRAQAEKYAVEAMAALMQAAKPPPAPAGAVPGFVQTTR